MRAALVCAAVAWALAGCALNRPESALPASFDLGPQPAYSKTNPAIPGAVLIPVVSAPAWLDEDRIVYRLLYEDPTRPQAYAMSRWAAAPAALLTDRLRSRFAAASGGVVAPGDGARADYTLRIELEDFSQRFDRPGASRVSLRARATLVGTAERKLLAQRGFDVERPAEPNATSAVRALARATDDFLEELVQWTVQNPRGK